MGRQRNEHNYNGYPPQAEQYCHELLDLWQCIGKQAIDDTHEDRHSANGKGTLPSFDSEVRVVGCGDGEDELEAMKMTVSECLRQS